MICSDNDDSVGCEESWTNISVLISDQRIETFEIDQKYILELSFHFKQARKLQATLEGCNPKLWLTRSLTDGGEV